MNDAEQLARWRVAVVTGRVPPDLAAWMDAQLSRRQAVPIPPSGLLRKATAARYIGISERALRRIIREGAGPPTVRVGSIRMHSVDDLDRWIAERSRPSTDQTGPART